MRALLLFAGLLWFAPVAAIDEGPAFDDPVMQARYRELIEQVRCLTCQNQTIKDSNAILAEDLRREIREQMAAGKTDEEIFRFLTERYGDFALYTTPFNRRTWILWLAGPLLLLTGGFVFARTVRRRAALPIDEPGEAP